MSAARPSRRAPRRRRSPIRSPTPRRQAPPQTAAPTPAWQSPPPRPHWQAPADTATWPAQPPAAQWQAPPPAGPWQPPVQPGGWQPPPVNPARRRKRTPLVIAALAVAALAAGVITWLAWPDDSPSLTYRGKEIASPGDVLSKTETTVDALVAKRHGAKNNQTRCYFARPAKPASGAKATDIDDNLQCGPVLFVDGNRDSTYLAVPLTSKGSSGGKATLESQSSLDNVNPAAVDEAVKLVRPDGAKAPAGNGGLEVPAPPPADKDLLAMTPLGATTAPPALSHAEMIGRDTKVTLSAASEVSRYGTGDAARSTLAGQRLVAFQLTYGRGDVSSAGSARCRRCRRRRRAASGAGDIGQ